MKYKGCLALIFALILALSPALARAEDYHVDVDIANQIVTVYTSLRHGEENIVRQMICSTGYGTSTPRGTFIMPEPKYPAEREEWYWFGKYKIYAKYASRIKDSILFHSILFPSTSSGPTWASSNALGYKASHGCVRLRVEDAKWIAENCLPGTEVHIFDDGTVDEDLRALLLVASFDSASQSYADFRAGKLPLSRGCKLSSVRDLQEALNGQGYDCGTVDGVFGAATEHAVVAWQEAMGVEADGVVSPGQLEALLAGTTPAPTPEPTPTPVPTPEPTPTPSPSPSPTPDISQMEGTVALVRVQQGSWLNLREKPDAQSAVLATLSESDPVQVLSEGPVWSMVQYRDKRGWVGSNYIEIVKQETEEAE